MRQLPGPGVSLLKGIARLTCLYCQFLLVMMALEERLVFPRGGSYFQQPGFAHEEVWLRTTDGVRLHAWYCPCPKETASAFGPDRPVVLYCHGNAGELTSRQGIALCWQHYLGADVLLFDYRGYGRSEGWPVETGLYRDSWAAYEYLTKKRGIDPDRILLVGRSLGGAVALELGLAVEHRALVLESTFTSLPDVAADIHPWIPVHALMRNRFPSFRRISRYDRPVFFSHGEGDRLIDVDLGRQLHTQANEPKELMIFEGKGHNDLSGEDYYRKVLEFLGGHYFVGE